MSAALVLAEYSGTPYTFRDDGWFNATEAAKKYGTKPAWWLRLPETQRYLAALCRVSKVQKSHFVRTVRGGASGQAGTWYHPKLAVPFARWLDIDFSVWCDDQIDAILRRKMTETDAARMREVGAIWRRRLGLEAKDATSKALASAGSRLMLDRKRELPAIKDERAKLETEMQPGLFRLTAAEPT